MAGLSDFILHTFNPHRLASCIVVCMTMFAGPLGQQTSGQESQDVWSKQMAKINPNIDTPFEIDEKAVLAAGIRKLSGRHIDLYTDVRETESAKEKQISELIGVFDLAVAQWCEYFEVDESRAANWKMRAFLIADEKDPSKFKKAGLIPADLPEFRAGFQRGHNIWLFLQPGNYYTRHLLLHEGTHGFMQWFANGYGAPWFSEGMAELFGVHRWAKGKLELRYRLRDRSESEYWGRVKRIKDEYAAGEDMSLSDVINIDPKSFLEVRYYAWSWAACEFFSKHEKTKVDFAALKKQAHVGPTQFNRLFIRATKPNWQQLESDWELFISEIEYGYELQRGRLTRAKPIAATFGSADTKFQINSQRSWQMTSIAVKKGERFRVTGKGEFKVGQSSDSSGKLLPWTCQSNGITIQYHQGNPLGILQAGVYSPDAGEAKKRVKSLVSPVSVGLMGEITAAQDGVLCLRVNESPAKLDDNKGALEVMVEKLK